MDGWVVGKNEVQVKPNTYRDYALYSSNFIVPCLGNKLLTKLTRKQVNAFYEGLSFDDVTAQTIRHIHRVFHHALEDAYEDEEIISNPAHKARLPRVEQKEMKFFNEEQVRILLIAVRGQIREPLYDLAVKLGPRQGELLGLKWEDVDFLHGTLKIKR
jgi:integrase